MNIPVLKNTLNSTSVKEYYMQHEDVMGSTIGDPYPNTESRRRPMNEWYPSTSALL